ncbi:MAG: hypothetical protein IPO17_17935 [Flavobacteriales bacterium]|nr:hypothetical protein [Flavobacteriales bacterium]
MLADGVKYGLSRIIHTSIAGIGQTWPDHRWDRWVFDSGYEVDFSTGQPIALPSGYLGTSYAHAAYSDPVTGVYRFRTDGQHVFNALGDTMANGASISLVPAWQTFIISIGSDQHLIFSRTTGAAQELRYSHVDMNANSGLGTVTAIKNILLATDVGSMAAFSSTLSDSTWLVYTRSYTPEIVGFPITSTGVGAEYIAYQGSASFSPSQIGGKNDRTNERIGFPGPMNTIQIFSCDRASGLLTDHVLLTPSFEPRSLEFSPNGDLLYVNLTAPQIPGSPFIEQFNLAAPDSMSIVASKTTVAVMQLGQGGVGFPLQLAPDGTILFHSIDYTSEPDSARASRIHYPDVVGLGCTVQPDAIYVGIAPVPEFGVNAMPSIWWPAIAPDVSVAENGLSPTSLELSPNPTDGLIQISVHGPALPDRWVLHDATGRVACEFGDIGAAMGSLDLSPVAAGLYTLCAWNKGQRLSSARVARQ